MEINATFRDPSLHTGDFAEMLARESRLVATLASQDPSMAHANWRLTGDSLQEASLYPAFDEAGAPSTASLAVLGTRAAGGRRGVSHAAIWNVAAADGEGAAISCHVSDAKVLPDRVTLDIDAPACCRSADNVADILRVIVTTFQPLLVEVSPKGYFERQVFDDKPGVGWMLYLPRVITVQQLPEARALLPVPEAGKNQTGTIIVSVADTVFSVDNPEHVEVANRIEIRLVDQDLLPRYSDL